MTPLDDFEQFAEKALQALVGLIFMAAGFGYIAFEKTHPPTHDAHLLAGLFVAFFGAACLPIGPAVVKALTATVGAFAQFVTALVQLLTRGTPPAPPTLPKDGP
jgi:hypothetical protein